MAKKCLTYGASYAIISSVFRSSLTIWSILYPNSSVVEHHLDKVRVGGSFPPSGTMSRSSRGLGRRPFTATTRVRISYGTPFDMLIVSHGLDHA